MKRLIPLLFVALFLFPVASLAQEPEIWYQINKFVNKHSEYMTVTHYVDNDSIERPSYKFTWSFSMPPKYKGQLDKLVRAIEQNTEGIYLSFGKKPGVPQQEQMSYLVSYGNDMQFIDKWDLAQEPGTCVGVVQKDFSRQQWKYFYGMSFRRENNAGPYLGRITYIYGPLPRGGETPKAVEREKASVSQLSGGAGFQSQFKLITNALKQSKSETAKDLIMADLLKLFAGNASELSDIEMKVYREELSELKRMKNTVYQQRMLGMCEGYLQPTEKKQDNGLYSSYQRFSAVMDSLGRQPRTYEQFQADSLRSDSVMMHHTMQMMLRNAESFDKSYGRSTSEVNNRDQFFNRFYLLTQIVEWSERQNVRMYAIARIVELLDKHAHFVDDNFHRRKLREELTALSEKMPTQFLRESLLGCQVYLQDK